MTGRLKISKQQKGQSIDTKGARTIEYRGNLFFVKPVLFILQQYRADRGESRKARWREKREGEKSSYFCNCFFFASAERKAAEKVLRNLNSLDSQGVVVLIISNREKTLLL